MINFACHLDIPSSNSITKGKEKETPTKHIFISNNRCINQEKYFTWVRIPVTEELTFRLSLGTEDRYMATRD